MGEMERLKEFNVKLSKKEFDKIGFGGVVKQLATKFDGGAEKLSKTALGVINTLKGYRGSLLRSVGDGILKPMKPRLDAINNWLANNQDTWGRWKDTVKGHGKKASEFVFSNLEKGFNHVQSRYLNNKDFMDLSFKGKVDFVMGDVKQWWNGKGKKTIDKWWEGSGKPWASKIGLSVGEAIFEGMKTGLMKGLSTLGDLWENAFENPSMKSIGGAGVATLGAGVIGSMILSPLLKVIAAPFKAGKWLKGKLPRSKSKTPVVSSSQTPSSGTNPPVVATPKSKGPVILDQYGKPLPPSGRQTSSTPRPIVTETVTNTKKKREKPFQKKNWPGAAPGSAPYPVWFEKMLNKEKKAPKIKAEKGLFKKQNWPGPAPRSAPYPAWLKKMIDRPDKEMKLPKQTTKAIEKMSTQTPAVKLPNGIDKLSSFGKRIPLLSAILGTAAVVGAPKGEKAKAVGGVGGAIAGGAAGAAGGAAIGSAVPIIGTAIGGLIGGIGGSILGGKGGESIGEWAGKKFGARKAEAAEVTPSGSAPTSSGEPSKMPDFAELNQHAQALTASVSGMASKAEAASHNIEAITMTLGESAGWVAGAFYPLQGATEGLQQSINAITMVTGEASGWVVGAFYPLQGATDNIQASLSILTSYIGQASGWVVEGFYGLSESTANIRTNSDLLGSYLGQASGWVVGAFYSLQGATDNIQASLSILTSYISQSSGWVVGAFYPLQGATDGLQQSISAITMTLGESAGWIAGAFYPLSGAGAMLTQNTTALGITLGESTAIVASSYLPLAGSGAMVNQNTMALGMVLGLSSAVVTGAYMPLAGAGPMLTGNTMALAMTLGMASGWVASLNGIQAGAAAVKGALSNLAARIASVPTPSVSVGGGGGSAPSTGKRLGGPKAYAKGGFINRPHLGLVGEAGPEMIIPLSSGRRGRAMELFNQTASMLGVRPYADGGLAGLEPILPGYGESEQPTLSLAGSMAGTMTKVGGAVTVSAPITVEINGGQTDEALIRDIVVNYSREFVEKLREALNNRSR